MMHLRGLVLFLLCLAGGARRSVRINDIQQDAQQQDNTLASELEVSAGAQEALIPGGSGTSVFRRAGTRAGALSKESKNRAAPSLRFYPRRTKDTQMAAEVALHNAGADVDAQQIEDAMWSLQHMLRDLVDNPEKIQKTLKGSPAADDPEQTAMIDDPEQQERDVEMIRQMARLVENSLEKGARSEATMQAFTAQMQQVLQQAHELMHDSELTKLLEQGSAAFAPRTASRTAPVTMQEGGGTQDLATQDGAGMQDLKDMAKGLNPAIGYWDPLNLVEGDFWGQGDEATIGFLRHAEIKHGRVAMAAFVGYIVQANGIHFPWKSTLSGITYDDIASAGGPADQWDALPYGAKMQIILFVGFLEFWSENNYILQSSGQAHYMRGGKPGAFPSLKKELPHPIPFDLFDPFGFQKNKSDEWKSKKLLAEINNGRLAMIGIMAFLAESKVPGSVPALTGLGIKPYTGEYMAPFVAGETSMIPDIVGKASVV